MRSEKKVKKSKTDKNKKMAKTKSNMYLKAPKKESPVQTLNRFFEAYKAGCTECGQLKNILLSNTDWSQYCWPEPIASRLARSLVLARKGKFVKVREQLWLVECMYYVIQVNVQLASLNPLMWARLLAWLRAALAALADILTVLLAAREMIKAVEQNPNTEVWDKFKGTHEFDRDTHIKQIACDTTITGVDDGVTVVIDEIPEGCHVTVKGNDGTINVKDNKGTITVEDNDDTIIVDNNEGTIDVGSNDDTIIVDKNKGDVTVETNEDTICVKENDGTVTVKNNDDTVIVDKNGEDGTVTVDGNDDTVDVIDNDGTVNVNGNSGGWIDDADVNVVDNGGGVINVNNNDGNVNVTKARKGTINFGDNPGDVNIE